MKHFSIVNETGHVMPVKDPEFTMVVKPTVQIGDQRFVADMVVCLDGPYNWPHAVVVEMHDCPYPSRGSGRRERLLREANVPVIRLNPQEMRNPDILRGKLREVVATGAGQLKLPVSVN